MYDRLRAEPDATGLFGLASEQAGYFTAAQARDLGYSWTLLHHHAATGRFVRLRRGLYRLRDYPSSPREEVMAAWLAVGKENAVVSHESALDLLDLSDVVPNAIDILIPRSRRGLPAWPGVALHTTTHPLRPEDIVTRSGIRLTAPGRTILDAAAYGTGPEQVIMAIEQAMRRGWIVDQALAERARERGRRVADLIHLGLQVAGRSCTAFLDPSVAAEFTVTGGEPSRQHRQLKEGSE